MEKLAQGLVALSQVHNIEYAYNPRELVFQHNKVKLYHYQAKKKNPHAIPTMVVFATVNRPEILDLFPERSFIGGLLESGLDVYLLDWGYPDENDRDVTLSHYSDYLHNTVKFIQKKSKQKSINLIGVCQGGLLCLGYAAISKHIKNLVLISTPVDFQTSDNLIYKLVRELDVKTMVSLTGNIPGAQLTQFFISLRPFELVGKKYLRFTDNVEDEAWKNKFLRVEKWLNDAPDQTGASFSELINDFYQQNKLVKGEAYLNNKRIDLKKLSIPVLNVIAETDEIIPPSASIALKDHIGSTDYSQKTYPSGHIGIYVSDKVGKKMPKEIAAWLMQRI